MKAFKTTVLVLTLMAGTALATAGFAVTDSWEFADVTRIKLDGVSGDVVILEGQGNTGLVELRHDVSPAKSFRPEVEQDGATLYIEEKWSGGSSHGSVGWTIHVPRGQGDIRISVDTASGDLECRGVSAQIEFETASGDIGLSGVSLQRGSDFSTASGDIHLEDMTVTQDCEFSTASGNVELEDLTVEEDCEFSTASGDVNAENCKGYFELGTASGDVEVRNCELMGPGEFSTASGDVDLHFDVLPAFDVSASSASGDVLLTANDFGDDFTLVMVKREDRGRITCPFKYTDEYTYDDYHEYEVKVVERGSGKPQIELRTASGKVTVKE
ncbi:MAG: DUF4097 family beta strand repeat-containing protein [bacterium]